MSLPALIFMFSTAGNNPGVVVTSSRVASAGAGGGRASAANAGTPT